MYREIFEKIIGFQNLNSYPILPCPYCSQKHLRIDTDTLHYKIVDVLDAPNIIKEERKKSITEIKDIYEESKFFGILFGAITVIGSVIEKPAKFVSFFKCDNCNKDVSATGTLKIDREEDINTASIKVEYFTPPIPIIKLSPNLPEKIREELIQAFNHFHSDLTSSGTKLRRAIERLCLDLGFKEKNLHFSITSMGKEYPQESEFLDSLKLLGNESVHEGKVNEHDLLDAFEVMDYVLQLYDRKKYLEIANMKALKLKEKFNKKPVLINKS